METVWILISWLLRSQLIWIYTVFENGCISGFNILKIFILNIFRLLKQPVPVQTHQMLTQRRQHHLGVTQIRHQPVPHGPIGQIHPILVTTKQKVVVLIRFLPLTKSLITLGRLSPRSFSSLPSRWRQKV